MNRLQRELQRLYLLPASEGPSAGSAPPGLVDGLGRVRALVLELRQPADWTALARVWQGVQADLALPAPAIAVSGRDGYQLWFSLAEPLPAPQAAAWLDAVCRRYLSDMAPRRVRCMPGPATGLAPHAELVPAPQADPGHWSAFVAPDLAPMFTEEPWLDTPPNLDGQASLLARLASIRPDELAEAQARLARAEAPAARPARAEKDAAREAAALRPEGRSQGTSASASGPMGAWQDPREFLRAVMNDGQAPLALRIEAAKALLSAPAEPRRAAEEEGGTRG